MFCITVIILRTVRTIMGFSMSSVEVVGYQVKVGSPYSLTKLFRST